MKGRDKTMEKVIDKLKEEFQITVLNSLKEYYSDKKNTGYYFIIENNCFIKEFIIEDRNSFIYKFYITKDNNKYKFKHNKLYSSTIFEFDTVDNENDLVMKIKDCFSNKYILKLISEHFEDNEYNTTYIITPYVNGFNIKFINPEKYIFTQKETFEKYSLFSSLVNVSLLNDNSINLELIE